MYFSEFLFLHSWGRVWSEATKGEMKKISISRFFNLLRRFLLDYSVVTSEFTRDKIMETRMACPKEFTTKPGTILLVSQIIKPLITK